jgi:hypothetical protein
MLCSAGSFVWANSFFLILTITIPSRGDFTGNIVTESKRLGLLSACSRLSQVLHCSNGRVYLLSCFTTFAGDYFLFLQFQVDASELPFRLLCKHYGAQVGYTPMMHRSQLISFFRKLYSNDRSFF